MMNCNLVKVNLKDATPGEADIAKYNESKYDPRLVIYDL